MFDLDGLEQVDPSPSEVNFQIEGTVIPFRCPSAITVEEVLKTFESWGVPYVNRIRFLAADGRTSCAKAEALPVAPAIVRLEGPGSVLTAVKVSLSKRNPAPGSGGDNASASAKPKPAPATKKVGLGPVHRSAFRQYQADLRGKVDPEAAQTVEDERRRIREVLRPLNEVLLRSRSEDLLGVLKLQEKPQVKRLLEDCNAGLQKLFLCYAAEPTARRSYWNSDSVTRFAVDFDFLGEVSNLPLQRMFQDACQNPNSVRADDKLFVEAFPLFLLMLANKTHAGQACPVEQDRVPLLFQRINAIACTSTQAPRFGLAKEPLLPLSKDAQTRRSSLVSMGEESRRQETGLSWDELLNSTF